MAELWYPLTITQTQIADGFEIVLATDTPCHLWLYHTMNPPWVHRITRLERGLRVPWDAYWCYTSWSLIEQEEAGDTTTHTFTWLGWVNCQTKYFRFHGTIGLVNSPSDSPIFHKHYFYEAPPVPAIEYLRPTGVGLITSIYAQEPDSGDHWDKLCDVAPDDNTYVYELRRGAYGDTYQTQNTAYDFPIDKVVIHHRCKGPGLYDYLQPRINTYTYYYGVRTYTTAVWAYYTWELVNNPHTDLPWTTQELNDLQIGLQLYSWLGDQSSCSHLYAAVHRSP